MKNQETATYTWSKVLKTWTVNLIVKEKLVFTGQFDTYVEAVEAIQEEANGEPRAILISSPK